MRSRRPVAHQRPASPAPGRAGATEDGVVGGLEVLPFGFLVFVAGSLLIANAWAVVDARMAASQAAREGARAFVEGRDEAGAAAEADQAAREALAGHGRDPARLTVEVDRQGFDRCSPVLVTVGYEVPAIHLPFGVGLGGPVHVSASHTELVDPLRDGLEGEGCG